jgi:trimeric autotransporter adhesin
MSIPRNLGNFAYNVDTSGQVSLTTGVTGTLPVANGGTGSTSTTFVNAATNVTGTLPVANGGTGQTTYTNGQLLIGNTTGNTLAKATLTQGSGISITNGAGSITIAATGGGTVTSVATGNGLTGGTITTSGTISLDFYTGSSSGNTSFPVGTYLFVVGSALYTLNTSYALYISGSNKYVTTSGTALSGTWTCRGNDNYGQSALFQRTS